MLANKARGRLIVYFNIFTLTWNINSAALRHHPQFSLYVIFVHQPSKIRFQKVKKYSGI